MVLVKKKDGSSHFCIDFRQLNRVTESDTYPLPQINELVDELHGTTLFTLLDSRSAYWSIPVAFEDRPKTAFSDGYRLFQWRRMPFGLSPAPTTFQRTMNAVLSPALRKPDYNRPFELHTDTSSVAIGACLMQRGEKGLSSVVSYFSRKLKGPETRYSATDSEALAVVEVVRHFDPYLYGREFNIFTDHRPLTFVFTPEDEVGKDVKVGL